MNYYAVNTSPSISHYGILGMKWGIRRFENPDGTLTAEGKRRYGTSENFRNSDYYKKYAKKKNQNEVSKTDSKTKLTPEEVAAKNRKATMKVAGVALGITAAATVIGVMAARHNVDKKAVDVGKDMVDRINIDKIPINTIKIDKFEPKKFEYEKFMPNYVSPKSYTDRAKEALSGIKNTASNMSKSGDTFKKASRDLDAINNFFTTNMSPEELYRKMHR